MSCQGRLAELMSRLVIIQPLQRRHRSDHRYSQASPGPTLRTGLEVRKLEQFVSHNHGEKKNEEPAGAEEGVWRVVDRCSIS